MFEVICCGFHDARFMGFMMSAGLINITGASALSSEEDDFETNRPASARRKFSPLVFCKISRSVFKREKLSDNSPLATLSNISDAETEKWRSSELTSS